MRKQEDIQYDMTNVVVELSQHKIEDPDITFEEAMKKYPIIKEKWDKLLTEAEELRSKGMWVFNSR
jgi:hypothetical protein